MKDGKHYKVPSDPKRIKIITNPDHLSDHEHSLYIKTPKRLPDSLRRRPSGDKSNGEHSVEETPFVPKPSSNDEP